MSLIKVSNCLPAVLIRFEVANEHFKTAFPRILGEHLAVTNDGVHRSAKFVAHVGKELALGAVGGFRGLH